MNILKNELIDRTQVIKETIRYLGYKRNIMSKEYAVDERTKVLIESSLEELEQVINVQFIYRILEICFEPENRLKIGKLQIESNSLYRNLKDCENVIVMCITLGADVDRIIKKYAIIDLSRAVVLQACAAALLEEYCDRLEEILNRQLEQELQKNIYFRPRFSPGYGDFSILHQRELLEMTEANKMIGLSMTDGYMLTPTKSVTALIGISNIKNT